MFVVNENLSSSLFHQRGPEVVVGIVGRILKEEEVSIVERQVVVNGHDNRTASDIEIQSENTLTWVVGIDKGALDSLVVDGHLGKGGDEPAIAKLPLVDVVRKYSVSVQRLAEITLGSLVRDVASVALKTVTVSSRIASPVEHVIVRWETRVSV